MSHLKIIIIKKERLRSNSICCTIGIRWVCFVHCGVLGSPFPPAPGSCPVQHTLLTASDPPLLRVAVTPFPFLLVQYFPRRELGEHFYLTQSTQGQQGWGSQGAAIHPGRIFAFGQLQNQIWVLCKEKVLPLGSEEQCGYSSLSQGTQRSRCRIPPAQDKAQCQLNSLWHMCDMGLL